MAKHFEAAPLTFLSLGETSLFPSQTAGSQPFPLLLRLVSSPLHHLYFNVSLMGGTTTPAP